MIKLHIETDTIQELDVVMARYAPEIQAAGMMLAPRSELIAPPSIPLAEVSAPAVEHQQWMDSPPGTPAPASVTGVVIPPKQKRIKAVQVAEEAAPEPEAEPETGELFEDPPEPTLLDCKAAMAKLAAAPKGGIKAVRAAVAKFDAADLGTLKPKDYAAFIAYCDERSGDDE